MLRVGLTGGAGSGKSTVAVMLQELGAFVSRSDDVGRAMMQPGESVYRHIVDHFGPEVLREDEHLDRAALARIAFQDGRVDELNRIVHPAVIRAQRDWMKDVERESPAAVAVVESALIFETRYDPAGEAAERGPSISAAPWRTRFDRIILVTAPEEIRLMRYLQRENVSEQSRTRVEQDARARFAAQMSDGEKQAMSDFVLINDGTTEDLRTQVERLYVALAAESQDRYSEAM